MSLEKLLYGAENISPHKKIFLRALLSGALLSVYGIWVDFVPSESWLYLGSIIALVLSATVILYVTWKKLSAPQQQIDEIVDWEKTISYIFMLFLLFGLMWIGIVHGLADIVTRNVGLPYTAQSEFSKDYSPGRRQCHYQLKGSFLDLAFPSYICISKSAYYALPAKTVFKVEGKRSFFGFHIINVYKEGLFEGDKHENSNARTD